MTTQRLFPAANGPGAPSAATGGWLLGVLFSVTSGMRWLNGYWHWVPPGGDTTAAKFALWNRYSTTQQALVPGSVVTSGTLTTGWNFTPLTASIQLAPGALYEACKGWTAVNGIPVTAGQFGSGDPLAAGIVNGFLTGWSAPSGSGAFPAATANYNLGQMLFSNSSGADPAVAMPINGSGDDNLWMDVQVSDTAPAGFSGSYRFRPNMADLGNFSLDTANGFTLGLTFSSSVPCTVSNGWFYTPTGVSVLPSKIGIYRVSDQALIGVNNSPSWSGAAASGWVSSPMPGVTLQAATGYRYVVFEGSNVIWNAAVANYWSTGFGASGLVSGPLAAPDNAAAAAPGQESYHQAGVITYPDTSAGPFDYGLDIEVTPVASGSGLLMAAGII